MKENSEFLILLSLQEGRYWSQVPMGCATI